MSSAPSKNKHPLPLPDLLRDLALIRASDTDLSEILRSASSASKPPSSTKVDETVKQSYGFVKEARAALKIQNRGDLDQIGNRLDRGREGLEEVLKGLEPTEPQA